MYSRLIKEKILNLPRLIKKVIAACLDILISIFTVWVSFGVLQDSWGWYLFIRGRVREAVVELEKAVKMKPNESTILEHLGDAYLRSNLREKAVDQYLVAGKYAENEEARRKIETKVQNIRKGSSLRGPQQSSGSKSENSPEQSDSHN